MVYPFRLLPICVHILDSLYLVSQIRFQLHNLQILNIYNLDIYSVVVMS